MIYRALLSVVGGVLSSISLAAFAAPIATGLVTVFRDNEGPNTIGSGTGDNLTIVVQNVSPNLTTYASATNPQAPGNIPLANLFTSTFGAFARTFAADALGLGGSVTQPWQVTLQNRADTLTVSTNSLAGVQPLPLLSNLAVTGGTALAPTLTWSPVVTSVPYDQVRVSIYNDRTDQVIVNEQVIGGVGTTSYTVPVGTLAPNANYAFRVYLWDSSGQNGTVLNRSSTHATWTTTSASVSTGAVSVTAVGGAFSALTLQPGENSHPNTAIGIGNFGRGAATLQNGTTLTGSFLNVGRDNYGTLIVDNTTVTMNGGPGINPQDLPSGGFVTAGRDPGGRGFIEVINGGKIFINSNGCPTNCGSDYAGPGLNIGRMGGSFGTVNVDGVGSRISINGPALTSASAADNGVINVGRIGDGRLNVLNGGQVINDAQGLMNIGRDAGSRGSILVSGSSSELVAGSLLNIGVIGPSGGGEGSLVIANGGVVRAGATILGAGGLLGGSGGTLISNLTVDGGVLSPGSSPGKLTIIGDLNFNDGIMLLEAFGPGQIDEIEVLGKIFIGADAEIDVLLGFEPTDVLSFFTATGGIEVESGFSGPSVYGLLGSGAPVGSLVTIQIGEETFEVPVQAAVPEPGTLALLGLGLAGLAASRRRKQ